MKLYRTTDANDNVRWSGSQAEATADRQALRDAAGTKSRDFATTDAVDVPTSKSELLAWLNTRKV